MADTLKKRKGFLSLFLKEDEAQADSPASTPETSASINTTSASGESLQGQMDDKIKTQLLDILTAADLPGYDYLEFRESLVGMAEIVPTEPERYKATYKAVSKLISVDKLVETAKFYLAKLQEKRKEFLQYVDELTSKNVTAKEAEVKNIEGQLIGVRNQISQLNDQIGKLESQKMQLLNDSVGEKGKITKVANNFDVTFNTISNGIEQDIKKINTYLKPSTK